MSFLSRTAVLVVLLAVVAPGCVAQEIGIIIGIIRVVRGEFPSERVMVSLQGRGAHITSTYTDGEGHFYFGSLPTNPYHVVINDSRYMPVDEMVIVNPSINPQSFVQITLVPRPIEKQPEVSPSGSNPYSVPSNALSKSYPKDALKEFEKGVKSEKEDRQEDAIGHYEKAIKIAPDFYPARNNLGSAYLRKSEFDHAKQQFQEAIRLNPSDGQAYFNMANLLLITKNTDAAVQQAREGLNRQPNSAMGSFVLGSALDSAGNATEAETALRRALELDPALSKAHLALVNIYLRSHRNTEAVAELKAFLNTSPHDPLAPKASELLKKLDAQSGGHSK